MGAEIAGHPAIELYFSLDAPPTLITVCAHCGEMRTILFLRRDRWYCTRCRMEGHAPPNMFPVA